MSSQVDQVSLIMVREFDDLSRNFWFSISDEGDRRSRVEAARWRTKIGEKSFGWIRSQLMWGDEGWGDES